MLWDCRERYFTIYHSFLWFFRDQSGTCPNLPWKQRGKELRQVAQGRGEPAEVIKEGAGRKTNIHIALFEVPGTIMSSVVLFQVSQHADSWWKANVLKVASHIQSCGEGKMPWPAQGNWQVTTSWCPSSKALETHRQGPARPNTAALTQRTPSESQQELVTSLGSLQMVRQQRGTDKPYLLPQVAWSFPNSPELAGCITFAGHRTLLHCWPALLLIQTIENIVRAV